MLALKDLRPFRKLPGREKGRLSVPAAAAWLHAKHNLLDIGMHAQVPVGTRIMRM